MIRLTSLLHRSHSRSAAPVVGLPQPKKLRQKSPPPSSRRAKRLRGNESCGSALSGGLTTATEGLSPIKPRFSFAKKIAIITFSLVVAVLGLELYSRINEARQDAAYSAVSARFRRDLPIGTSREKVEEYLQRHGMVYYPVRYGGTQADTDEVKLGEEGTLNPFCESWTVYVAFEFTSAETLQDVHIRKVGTCL
jgi:hypothetical protein